jgi:hypothetical protein
MEDTTGDGHETRVISEGSFEALVVPIPRRRAVPFQLSGGQEGRAASGRDGESSAAMAACRMTWRLTRRAAGANTEGATTPHKTRAGHQLERPRHRRIRGSDFGRGLKKHPPPTNDRLSNFGLYAP